MTRVPAAMIAGALALSVQSRPITISGRVVADETGEPIRNARVGVTPVVSGPSVAIADADGRFTFAVPAGKVSISASKPGYARTEATAAAGHDAIEIRLRRGAAISGRVLDDLGDPVIGARVAALAATDAPTVNAVVATADTDDRGEYRLASLAAGTFVVRVTTAGAVTSETTADGMLIRGIPSTHLTFYPEANRPADAEPIRVQPGEDKSAIDFTVPPDHWSGQVFGAMQIGPLNRTIDPNPTGATTGVVRGRVVSTDGRSVPHAELRLAVQGDLRQSLTSLADADGRFEFTALPPGTFQVIASKAGYEPAIENPPKVELREGETRERIDVTLMPWGSLAGRVFDENGDPMQGASVRVLQVRYEAGRRHLVPAGSAPRLTDDLGRYRLHSLPPGAYIVSASVGDVTSADLPGYTRAYFPGTTTPGAAQFVSVAAAEVVTGIDVSLSRARTARVAGRLIGADGQPTMGGRLELVPASSSVVTVPSGARIQPDGRFEFTNVPPGQYTVRAQRNQNNPWTEGEFGMLPVAVDGADVTGLALQLAAGSVIRGRVTFDATDPSKTPPASQVQLMPVPSDFDLAPGHVATAQARADLSFELLGITGPRRLQLQRAPAGWALKEILVRGIDVTDRVLPFGRADQSLNDVEVVLTDRVSELSGVVNDDRGQPTASAHVIVFATTRDRWYPGSRFMRTALAASTGAFSITGLPFGTYYVAAVTKLPPYGDDAWQDPEFLETLTRSASSVTIREGETSVVTLIVPAVK